MKTALARLLDQLQLDPARLDLADSAFEFKAHANFLAQIQPGNANDPLLKQILPVRAEHAIHPDFKQDPVGDLQANPLPSLIHKYHGRVLLMASPRCDIHCRYCFRRHFPYETQINQRHWQQALAQIAADTTVHEVILSGGDPLTLSEAGLLNLARQIEAMPHIKTLRIHSRTPIVAPTKAPQGRFLDWAKHSHLNKVLVVHCNHANELSDKTAALMQHYRAAGFHLLNQSVLLKGINDDADTLANLSQQLLKQGILPYYLHQLDRVQGAAHFEVEEENAKRLVEKLRRRLPGYLVPKLVKEIAGEPHKTPI